jgi:hypothetical protein
MFLKFVSLVNLMCALAILSVDLTNPADPLFFIVSGGVLEEVVRFSVVFALIFVTFITLPTRRGFRNTLMILGWPLMALGVVGFLTNSFDYSWYGMLKPLDFLLLIETGIVMNVLALEPQRSAHHFVLLPNHRHMLISAFTLRLQKLKSAS